jgi:hypothetical protein
MRTRKGEPGREHGFHDEEPERGWSPERQRLAEQLRMLTRTLRSPEESVRELAVVQLSLLGPKVVPYLTSALEDALDESDLRQTSGESNAGAEREIAGICSAMGIIRDSEAVVDLATALPRREAVEALAKIGGERALDLIMDAVVGKPGHSVPLSQSWRPSPDGSAETDPAFVRRVFLHFGERGRRRLQEELASASGSRRAAVKEIIRIMGYSDAPA